MPRSKATDPARRENQLIALAVDLAEKQLAEGSASAQVICHYLKMGSEKERLEMERLKAENELLKAKRDSLKSAHRLEDLYVEAIAAMKKYSGQGSEECEVIES